MNDANIDDEILSAYLDGELDAEQASRVAAALESDPGARVRLERMRSADQRLRRDLAPRDMRKVDPLAEYILRIEGNGEVAPRRRVAAPVWALAAGIAGVLMGFLLARGESGGTPGYASGELRQTLEHRLSGEPAKEGAGSRVLLTIRTSDDRTCRLFSSQEAASAGEGLACRDEIGWKVIAWDGSAPSGGFRPAGASPLLDETLEKWDAAVLDDAAERELLAREWRAAPK